jgi:hypothetical protein
MLASVLCCVQFCVTMTYHRREINVLHDLYFMQECYIALFINEHIIFSVMTVHFVTGICFCTDVWA